MTPEEAKTLSELFAALAELPKAKRSLTPKHPKGRSAYVDSVYLELAAAEMSDGVGQGSNAYLYVPPSVGRKILTAAEKIIRDEIVLLGGTIPKRSKA